ncbi:hypothetical protein AS189_11100 [Arthrobacter alpinus]|uniref:Uncharacterized protein n=1 Tax=Arthrobacter alpinus TaxID=656366 RepID=A0A0S2LZN6_9MICC|nr:hypothetical protein AS189_11100 [Arthrobacter alpinus]
MEARASRTLAAVILQGRPPLRPHARVEASPEMVRSEMSSRSNSASAAKIPKTSLPEAVVVSIAAPSPVRYFQADASVREVMEGIHQVTQVPAESVELPYQQGVSVT